MLRLALVFAVLALGEFAILLMLFDVACWWAAAATVGTLVLLLIVVGLVLRAADPTALMPDTTDADDTI